MIPFLYIYSFQMMETLHILYTLLCYGKISQKVVSFIFGFEFHIIFKKIYNSIKLVLPFF